MLAKRAERLHIGCGRERLEGWVNVDLLDLPGVDVVADVTRGLDFKGVEAAFAEHFIEHLAVDDALRFLKEVHRVMVPGGRVRLSTPNLDWVWATHYDIDAAPDAKLAMALDVNRAFHAWGHQFLWNREMLAAALTACGFDEIEWKSYGESDHELFRGLERHERWHDVDGMAHVLIVEAVKGPKRRAELVELVGLIRDKLLDHVDV